jgi:hypothetical protein
MNRHSTLALATCGLSLLWPGVAGAAIVTSPEGPSVRNAVRVVPQGTRKPQPKPEPAPADFGHYAEPQEFPPTWKI